VVPTARWTCCAMWIEDGASIAETGIGNALKGLLGGE
jgi:hypothetical protein